MNLGGVEKGVNNQKTLNEILKELIKMGEIRTKEQRGSCLGLCSHIFAGGQGLGKRRDHALEIPVRLPPVELMSSNTRGCPQAKQETMGPKLPHTPRPVHLSTFLPSPHIYLIIPS